jgi:putative transposase
VSEALATIERAYRVRLRPTKAQARTLQRLFGARRFVWNWAIRRQREPRRLGVTLNAVALSREFTALKQAPETSWLAELPREPFNQTLRDLDRAWANWRRGDAKPPRRKRFGTVQSARFTLDQRRELVDREHGTVQVDGFGKLRFRVTEPLLGRLRSVTVSRDTAGRWFASFTADRVPAPAIVGAARPSVGLDLGMKSTATLSTGQTIAAPKHLAAKLKRLRRYQRRYTRGRDAQLRAMGLDSRKPIPKGTRLPVSNRMRRTAQRIGGLHAQVADARRDHQHQVSAAVVATAQVIAIEDLAVKAMGRALHRGFRRNVADAGLGALIRQVTYKAAWQQRVVVAVDRYFPSSKTCSACGGVNAALTLRHRAWPCPACGVHHDRDVNAAVNIEREGLRLLAEGNPGPDGRTPRSGGTDAREEDTAPAGKASPARRASSVNRELISRGALRHPSRRGGMEPPQRETG